MESLESILSDLHGKYKDPQSGKQHITQQEIANLLSQSINQPAPIATSLDRLLNDLRDNSLNYSPSQITPEVITNQALPAIDRDLQQVADRQKAKEDRIIAQKATEWLKHLDPLCSEGLWFEEFAKNYSSRLEAAIALLQSQ
ncbi:MAG: hypothetical protein DCF19_05860 [Pseudanabaena frigida]|uniref:Uncharacterized protein n=1 Tax=Pseudanabaena frigida TaxID=945775 RepID=A0A2W4WG77_9CYAN|nr:MAG: hypothetical protein DCF19_05860 [Pseudanabaena frigida]